MGIRCLGQPLASREYSRTVGAGQEIGEKAAGKKEAGAPAMDGDH